LIRVRRLGYDHGVLSTHTRQRFLSPDLLAVTALVLTGVVISWPILRGGYLTYVDNAAHLTEIYSLAFDAHNGWSDAAFCGYPLGNLHSPLWYGLLGLFVRAGLPAGALYAFCLLLAFMAPALALYYVARRRLSPWLALTVAYVLLIQRPSFLGLGSALGGMWTHYLAAAALILLIDRLTREVQDAVNIVWIAVLVGFIGMTHFFAYVALIIVGAFHVARSLLRIRSGGSALGLQIVAGIIGVVASARYWAPTLLTSEHTTIYPQNLPFDFVVARLLVPTNVLSLVFGKAPALSPQTLIEAVPMVLLVATGIAGFVRLRGSRSSLALYGGVLAVVMFVLVAFVAPARNATFLGPVSWRMLYFVRIGCALGAVGLLIQLGPRIRFRPQTSTSFGGVALMILLGGLWSMPVARATPGIGSIEMQEVSAVWEWLRDTDSRGWGRVYVQDTFHTAPLNVSLKNSHVMAMTGQRAGVRQLGATYGVVPYPTATWTMGEFGTLYRRLADTPERQAEILRLMDRTNVTHVVVADPRMATDLERMNAFELLRRWRRFHVFARPGAASVWVSGEAGAVDTDFQTGRMEIRIPAGEAPGPLLVKVAFHPFWEVSGSGTATIRSDDEGLILLENTKAGESVVLEYIPPRWPALVSTLGWVLIALLGATALLRRQKPVPDTTVRSDTSVNGYFDPSESV